MQNTIKLSRLTVATLRSESHLFPPVAIQLTRDSSRKLPGVHCHKVHLGH
jgi:hypothetical protein